MRIALSRAPQGFGRFRRPALVVGHPGHELKVFGWLSQNNPRLFVLTDGSGHTGMSRISSTTELLSRTNGSAGSVFGSFSDQEIYSAILNNEIQPFLGIVDQLAETFLQLEVDFVAGDAAEGYNPTHDLCRQLIDGATALAQRVSGKAIANFSFCLTEWQQNGSPRHDDRCFHLCLDDELLARKLQAASCYAGLGDEVNRAVKARGLEYFRVECLRAAVAFSQEKRKNIPDYEAVGEDRVATGKYQRPIRYRSHMLPILRAIRRHASRPLDIRAVSQDSSLPSANPTV